MDIDPTRRRAFVRNLLRWARENGRSFPWREEGDPFRVLVAEILLQRSRAKTVAGVYDRLFDRWPTAERLADADVADVEDVIRSLGLIGRAAYLVDTAGIVAELGRAPGTVDELMQLPGVGPYAANATAAAALGKRRPTVDAVSARVYRRYFGLVDVPDGAGHKHVDDRLWELVERATPRTAYREWNWAVLDLAADVCLPKRPDCPRCPLRRRCAWRTAQASGA